MQFRKGDRVFGLAPWFWMACKEVTYAEYVSAKEDWLAYAPKLYLRMRLVKFHW